MNKTIRIEPLTPANVTFLLEYLERNKENFKYFQPHPFTFEYLYNISLVYEKDFYSLIFLDKQVIGYGMLRGLDEGYKIPSMGVSSDREFSHMGLATMLIKFMEMSCKLNGIYKVRIGVMKGNPFAKSLYENLGYNFTQELEDREYAIKDLR
jgi:[ribosomal protein S18]-alanine N-acetyltransferase